MNSVLEAVLRSGLVTDEKGAEYPLSSAIDKDEGLLIRDTIRSKGLKHGVEIGCAYGISSLFVSDALVDQVDRSHTIIDPFQSTDWNGIGRLNLKRVGADYVEFIEEPSELALPQLLSEGRLFDFAVIDGYHTFDHTLVDFFYLNKMLRVGGVVFIDDVTFPGIKKAVRHILRYPAYKLYAVANLHSDGPTRKRRVADGVMRVLASMCPASYRNEVFSHSWTFNDWEVGISCSMVALEKVAPDNRAWNWHEPF